MDGWTDGWMDVRLFVCLLKRVHENADVSKTKQFRALC